MKSIRYSSFLLIVLKRKKTKSSAIFSRKLIVFAPPIMCMCNFTDFFFLEILPITSSHSSLPFIMVTVLFVLSLSLFYSMMLSFGSCTCI